MNNKFVIPRKSDRTITKIDYLKGRGFDSSISNSKNSFYVHDRFRTIIDVLHLNRSYSRTNAKLRMEKLKVKKTWSNCRKGTNVCPCQVLWENTPASPVFEKILVH